MKAGALKTRYRFQLITGLIPKSQINKLEERMARQNQNN